MPFSNSLASDVGIKTFLLLVFILVHDYVLLFVPLSDSLDFYKPWTPLTLFLSVGLLQSLLLFPFFYYWFHLIIHYSDFLIKSNNKQWRCDGALKIRNLTAVKYQESNAGRIKQWIFPYLWVIPDFNRQHQKCGRRSLWHLMGVLNVTCNLSNGGGAYRIENLKRNSILPEFWMFLMNEYRWALNFHFMDVFYDLIVINSFSGSFLFFCGLFITKESVVELAMCWSDKTSRYTQGGTKMRCYNKSSSSDNNYRRKTNSKLSSWLFPNKQ